MNGVEFLAVFSYLLHWFEAASCAIATSSGLLIDE